MKFVFRFLVTIWVLSAPLAWAQESGSVRPAPPVREAPFRTAYDSAQAVLRLRAQLDHLFTAATYSGASVGVVVRAVKSGKVLYERNPTAPLTPASNTKLFSTLAVFHALGAGGTIATEVRATARIDPSGTLKGDLYLVGRGDVMLSAADMEVIADELFAMGLRTVRGTIYGDGSWFDSVTNRAVYSGDFEDVVALPPVTALSHTGGQIAVVVSATGKGYVTAQTVPASESIIVRTTTKKSGRRRRLSATSAVDASGRVVITVSGSPGANRTQTLYVPARSPELVAAGTLANRLRTGGIGHEGTIAAGVAPRNARLLVAFERPFLEIASVVNKRSHNHYAEHVFKLAAALYGGAGSGADQGKAALLAALDSLDVQHKGAVFHDGSGLSRRNRVSARTQVDMLCAIAGQPYFNDFYSSLAIAGVDGSLRRRMIGTPAHDNLRGKTGTLRNVSSLGGYVTTSDGELLAFSMLSNGPRTGSYKSTENAAGSILAAFTYAPAEKPSDVSNPAPDPESDPESDPETDAEEEQQEPHADVEE